MSNNILFDNLLITDDENVADEWAAQTYDLKKKQIDKDAVSAFRSNIMQNQFVLFLKINITIKW